MEQVQNKGLNKTNISIIFLFLFIIAVFFPIRYVFSTIWSFKTGQYSDFTSISLYLSDILLLLSFFFLIMSRGKEFYHVIMSLKYLLFWLILGLFWYFYKISTFNLFIFAKFLELIVLYGTAALLFKDEALKTKLVKFFACLGVIQAIMAICQFYKQSSIGLNKLGEQIISPHILGVAKIISNAATYIRGYGTFPHPNLLAAFLVVTILFLVKLFINEQNKLLAFAYILGLFISIMGFTLTFSRAGFLGLAMALTICFGYQFVKKIELKKTWLSLITILIFILINFLIFKPLLLTRATFSDQASIERSFYDKIGVKIIKDRPVFGVGIGESVMAMQNYTETKLWPWEIQPTHNYFLLAAAEMGIPGALILLWLLLTHLWKTTKQRYRDFNFVLGCVLFSFLTMMFFDHYFYTLQQTQMLLWLILGLIAAGETQTSGIAQEPKIG